MTLLLRKTRDQARIEGLNPDLWAADDYSIVDPDINKRVGRDRPGGQCPSVHQSGERQAAREAGCGLPCPRTSRSLTRATK
jgi:hypothetical protein